MSHWPRNVVLIGFMGCGKSSIGHLIARKLHYRFVDTDRLIVQQAGSSIPRIFAEQGEEAFRELESNTLRSLLGKSHCVISTGGGVVTRPCNLPVLRDLGTVVWLTAPEDVLFDRVSRNSKRPLLRTANPRATLHELLEQRRPLYASVAHVTVDTGGLSHARALHAVLDALRQQPQSNALVEK